MRLSGMNCSPIDAVTTFKQGLRYRCPGIVPTGRQIQRMTPRLAARRKFWSSSRHIVMVVVTMHQSQEWLDLRQSLPAERDAKPRTLVHGAGEER